jgi:hypothetical protein
MGIIALALWSVGPHSIKGMTSEADGDGLNSCLFDSAHVRGYLGAQFTYLHLKGR